MVITSLHSIHTPSVPAHGPMHSCWAFIHPINSCGSSPLGTPLDHPTLCVRSLSPNTRFIHIRFGRCESSTVLPHRDCVKLEMHLVAVFKQAWRCTWRPCLGELKDTLGGWNWANSAMQWEAMSMRTCRPRLSEVGNAFGSHRWLKLEENLEAADRKVVDLQGVDLGACSWMVVNLDAFDQ